MRLGLGIEILLLLTLTSTPVWADVPTIFGELKAEPSCGAENQVWVSKDSLLIYQTEVPSQGTFEFYLTPGKYNVTATSNKGCIDESELEVKKGQRVQLVLKLKGDRKISSKGKKK